MAGYGWLLVITGWLWVIPVFSNNAVSPLPTPKNYQKECSLRLWCTCTKQSGAPRHVDIVGSVNTMLGMEHVKGLTSSGQSTQ